MSAEEIANVYRHELAIFDELLRRAVPSALIPGPRPPRGNNPLSAWRHHSRILREVRNGDPHGRASTKVPIKPSPTDECAERPGLRRDTAEVDLAAVRDRDNEVRRHFLDQINRIMFGKDRSEQISSSVRWGAWQRRCCAHCERFRTTFGICQRVDRICTLSDVAS